MPRVYASLPLTGPLAALGRDVLRGAELALEARGGGVELVAVDSFGPDREAQAAENARRAVEDAKASAYLGDFHSSQVLASAPVLSAAGMLQVAPVATYVGLEGETLVRLSPHDGAGAHAIARWLAGRGIERLLVVHDHDHDYGVPVGHMCVQAARDKGLDVRDRPIWNHDEPMHADLDRVQAVLYVGVAGSGAVGLWHDLHAHDPDLWLLGSEGVMAPWLAARISAEAAARTRFFAAQRAPMAMYGYEAMALVLDAIAAGGDDDRQAIAQAARATTDRDSIIGRYSLDDEGCTTSAAYGCLAVVDGALCWDTAT